MRRAEYTLTSDLGFEWSSRVAVPFYLNLETRTASSVGRILHDFDMEIRRTTSYQLRSSTVLPKSSQFIEIVETDVDSSLRIAIGLSNELRLALTKHPVEFLINLDWFWDLRYSQSRVRSPTGQRNPHERWERILSSVSECTAISNPVAAEMVIGSHGVTTFNFRSESSN